MPILIETRNVTVRFNNRQTPKELKAAGAPSPYPAYAPFGGVTPIYTPEEAKAAQAFVEVGPNTKTWIPDWCAGDWGYQEHRRAGTIIEHDYIPDDTPEQAAVAAEIKTREAYEKTLEAQIEGMHGVSTEAERHQKEKMKGELVATLKASKEATAKLAHHKEELGKHAAKHGALAHREEALKARLKVLHEHPGHTPAEKEAVAKEKAAHEKELAHLRAEGHKEAEAHVGGTALEAINNRIAALQNRVKVIDAHPGSTSAETATLAKEKDAHESELTHLENEKESIITAKAKKSALKETEREEHGEPEHEFEHESTVLGKTRSGEYVKPGHPVVGTQEYLQPQVGVTPMGPATSTSPGTRFGTPVKDSDYAVEQLKRTGTYQETAGITPVTSTTGAFGVAAEHITGTGDYSTPVTVQHVGPTAETKVADAKKATEKASEKLKTDDGVEIKSVTYTDSTIEPDKTLKGKDYPADKTAAEKKAGK